MKRLHAIRTHADAQAVVHKASCALAETRRADAHGHAGFVNAVLTSIALKDDGNGPYAAMATQRAVFECEFCALAHTWKGEYAADLDVVRWVDSFVHFGGGWE